MSPELAPLILIGLFGYVVCAVLAFAMPWFGFMLLITIPVVKVVLRQFAGGLLAGYTYDMAVAVLAILSVISHRNRNPGVPGAPLPGYLPFCWFMIAIMLWFGTFFGKEFGWAMKKSLIFSVFNTMAIATLPLFLLRPADARLVLRVMLIAGIGASFALPIFGRGIGDWAGSRMSLAGASPLAVADLGANAIIILIAGLIQGATARNLTAAVVFIPVCAAAIMMTGTRGPILGIPILLPILFWIYRRRINFQTAMGSLVGLGVIFFGTLYLLDPGRLNRFSGGEIGDSILNRFGLLTLTLRGFVTSPIIGRGTGSTSTLINDGVRGLEDYPHNHVLEVAYELGLLGLIPWFVLIFSGLKAGWSLADGKWDNHEAKFVAVPFYIGFLYHLLMSFKMGTFAASYMLYFYLCGTLVLYHMRDRDYRLWQQQMAQWQYMQQQQAALEAARAEAEAQPALQAGQ